MTKLKPTLKSNIETHMCYHLYANYAPKLSGLKFITVQNSILFVDL